MISPAAIVPKNARIAISGSTNVIPEKIRIDDTIEMGIYGLLRTCSYNSYIVFFVNYVVYFLFL